MVPSVDFLPLEFVVFAVEKKGKIKVRNQL